MKPNNYIIINNKAYNPVTGLPIEGVTAVSNQGLPASQPESQTANKQAARGISVPGVHNSLQKSATLSRRYVKKPISTKDTATASAQTVSQANYSTNFSPVNLRPYTVQKSESVHRFPSSQPVQVRTTRVDRPAETHPVARRAASRVNDISPNRRRAAKQQKFAITPAQSQQVATAQFSTQKATVSVQASVKQTPVSKPSHVIKNEAIQKALQNEISHKQTFTKKQRKQSRGWGRFLSLGTASLAIVMLAGYLTYLSMPNLSVRMAAVQSGVNAKYPGYRPDGYALKGPITFKEGEVAMNFAYSGDDQGFTLTQKRSNWDSSAVKQYVDTKSGKTSATTVDGLTIYTYDNDAVWVNSGVLYAVESDTPLSNAQIQRIATSM